MPLARSPWCLIGLVLLGMTAGCGDAPPSENIATETPPPPVAPVDTAESDPTARELREKLGASEVAQFRKIGGRIRIAELGDSGVTDLAPLKSLELWAIDLRNLPVSDLSPLEGMPLQDVFMEATKVADLTPLSKSPLKKLYANHTPVSDLKPLAGMDLTELNLYGSQVEDISPLKDVAVGTLWLRDTKVKDIAPLADRKLVSLDLESTPVSDLSPLREMSSLQRLNIAGTEVTDITPLEGARLTRLIFTPSRITKGLEVVRGMTSLTELDVTFREPGRLAPDEFWKRYDAGEFAEKSK